MSPVVCLELVHDVFEVETYGRFRNPEIARNLFVPQTIADKPKDIQFTAGKLPLSPLLCPSGGNVCRNAFAPTMYLTDDIEQFVFIDALEYVGQSTGT